MSVDQNVARQPRLAIGPRCRKALAATAVVAACGVGALLLPSGPAVADASPPCTPGSMTVYDVYERADGKGMIVVFAVCNAGGVITFRMVFVPHPPPH